MAPRKPKSAVVVGKPVVVAAPVESFVAVAEPVVPPQPEAAPEIASPIATADMAPTLTSAHALASASAVASEPVPDLVPDMAEAVDAVVATSAELQDSVRLLTEQGLEQTRTAYARLRSAAEDATDQFEASYMTASTGLREFHTAAFEAFRTNADATFEFLKAMLCVRDLSEAIKLQTDHMRKQVETFNGQAKDLGAVAQRVAATSAEALKATFERGLGRAA